MTVPQILARFKGNLLKNCISTIEDVAKQNGLTVNVVKFGSMVGTGDSTRLNIQLDSAERVTHISIG